MKRYVLDPRLVLFATLAAGASVIAAHGSWIFFGYLVDPNLAAVFVAVVAIGIIGLDAAATLDRRPAQRAAYLGGMGLFLVMETLANYFAAQSTFVANVLEKIAPDSDLAAIARGEPFWSRVLVVVFLSLASLAVAAFTFAAASRVAQIRAADQRDQTITARYRRLLAQRRGLVERLTRMARGLRETVASLSAELATTRAHLASKVAENLDWQATVYRLETDLANAREQLARWGAEIDLLRETIREREEDLARAAEQRNMAREGLAVQEADLASLREQLASREEEVARYRDQLAKHGEQVAGAREKERNLREELAALRAELASRPASMPPTRAQVVAYARARMDAGASRAQVAAELGWTESSLRGWMAETSNGHAVAVAE